jgi:hypothetical protein
MKVHGQWRRWGYEGQDVIEESKMKLKNGLKKLAKL